MKSLAGQTGMAKEVCAGHAAPENRCVIYADKVLSTLVDLAAATLVALEIVILFSGVVARYVLQTPITWSDELASILFLWLAMLGSVVALRRGEHMRMTAFVSKATPATRALLDVLALSSALAFLGLIMWPAFEFASEEVIIITPALEISNAWRAAALPVGIGLMILTSFIRFFQVADFRLIGKAVAAVAVIVLAFYIAQPLFSHLGKINLIIFFVGLVAAAVLAGVPIAFSFGLATYGYLVLTTSVPIPVMIGRMDEGMSHLILLSVPLFVFLGLLIEMTGMAKAMVTVLANFLGHVRGGLSYVLIGAMYLVSGISGSKAADMAAISPVLFPEMKQRGAKSGELVALLAATGAQTETIPPSIVLITIGSVTGVSIAALFTGGLLPGVILGLMLSLVVWFRYRNEDLSNVRRASRTEIMHSLMVAIPALLLPFVIRVAVVNGIATATEVSTIGIVYSIIVGLLIYREFDWARIRPMLTETAALSGAILLIIGTATAMAWCLTRSGFSTDLARVMKELPGGPGTFIAVSILAFIILGSVLEGIPAIVLFGPLLFPIAREIGVHEVHYAMIVILAMGMGLFAPPFGVGFYVASAIAKTNPDEAIRPILGYMLALFVGILTIAMFPWISIGFLT
jgi:tripartite ATP-independent transporter DctM subunit